MDNIDRITQIDSQLKTLDKMIKDGEYLAAGVSITINVGPQNPDMEPDLKIDLGLSADLQKIMADIREGLVAARDFRVRCARQELSKLQAFLDTDSLTQKTA